MACRREEVTKRMRWREMNGSQRLCWLVGWTCLLGLCLIGLMAVLVSVMWMLASLWVR